MTNTQLHSIVQSHDYDFLRTNEHLKDYIMFLTLGGSHAYGTNTETSDVDVRGCAMNSQSDILGMSNFEQYVDAETDTTIYGFRKLVGLLLNCNPNTIEMLGCKPEHYLYVTHAGSMLLRNRKIFLSRRATQSFGGYATAQLRRLENAIARDKLPQAKKEEHILGSMQNALAAFRDKYESFDLGKIHLYTDVSERDDLDREIFADIQLEKFPARSFCGMLNELANILKDYDKLNGRNRKKDDNHLNKHAMHLIRLYLMCLDILEKEEIVTYREADHDLLMSVRNGDFQQEDGTYRDEFFQMVQDFEKRLAYAKENTGLPSHPDMKKVEELVMCINYYAATGDNKWLK